MAHASDPVADAAQAVMTLYPRIYFACHTRHVRDPQTQRLLSRHQASVLDHLDEIEPTTLVDLSRHMGVTPGTMSVAIDRLERKGYVVRLRDAADRRKVHVRLTSAGVRVRDASSVLDPARVEALVDAPVGRRSRHARLRGWRCWPTPPRLRCMRPRRRARTRAVPKEAHDDSMGDLDTRRPRRPRCAHRPDRGQPSEEAFGVADGARPAAAGGLFSLLADVDGYPTWRTRSETTRAACPIAMACRRGWRQRAADAFRWRSSAWSVQACSWSRITDHDAGRSAAPGRIA